MGYSTTFCGQIAVVPPLNKDEITYLQPFNETRHMVRKSGPYNVDTDSDSESDVIDHNSPADSQPGLYCQWIPSENGKFIQWDGGEKFYHSGPWLQYLIDHFLSAGAQARKVLPFFKDHRLDGLIEAQGETTSDKWYLLVTNNKVEKLSKEEYEARKCT